MLSTDPVPLPRSPHIIHECCLLVFDITMWTRKYTVPLTIIWSLFALDVAVRTIAGCMNGPLLCVMAMVYLGLVNGELTLVAGLDHVKTRMMRVVCWVAAVCYPLLWSFLVARYIPPGLGCFVIDQ